MSTEDTPSLEESVVQADRRGAERYTCDLQPFWRIVGDDRGDATAASIRDVSRTGIGLRVPQSLKPGVVLVLTLRTRDQRLSRPLPVRVMHATLQAEGDFLIGCKFVRPLSVQDLRALVGDE